MNTDVESVQFGLQAQPCPFFRRSDPHTSGERFSARLESGVSEWFRDEIYASGQQEPERIKTLPPLQTQVLGLVVGYPLAGTEAAVFQWCFRLSV